MSSQFTAVRSCRLDTRITTRKSDIAVQIFQLTIMLSVTIGWFGFVLFFGFGLIFACSFFSLPAKLSFFFSPVFVVSGHLGLQGNGTPLLVEAPAVVVKASVLVMVVVSVVAAASVRLATGVTVCRHSGNDAVHRHNL